MPIKGDKGMKVLEFGYGDIIVAPSMVDGKLNSIVFAQDSICREIGERNTHGVIGKSHRELGAEVAMHFENLESLNVVIRALKEVRQYFNLTVEMQKNINE